ncbi:MAG: hypothetical protein K5773_04105 [Pseudobutyrivibrio sp.]|nr:hypothetical protein [Pseudobutyrivibrio sp.]
MSKTQASNTTKLAASVIGLMMLVIVLFSAFFITTEMNHDCSGEDCPICASIQLCESTLNTLGDGLSLSSFVIIPFIFLFFVVVLFRIDLLSHTLISNKVRLNN